MKIETANDIGQFGQFNFTEEYEQRRKNPYFMITILDPNIQLIFFCRLDAISITYIKISTCFWRNRGSFGPSDKKHNLNRRNFVFAYYVKHIFRQFERRGENNPVDLKKYYFFQIGTNIHITPSKIKITEISEIKDQTSKSWERMTFMQITVPRFKATTTSSEGCVAVKLLFSRVFQDHWHINNTPGSSLLRWGRL